MYNDSYEDCYDDDCDDGKYNDIEYNIMKIVLQ